MNVALGVESASETGIIVTYALRAEWVIGLLSNRVNLRGHDMATHPL